MGEVYKVVPKQVQRVTRNSSTMVRLRGREVDLSKRAVLVVHGWSHSLSANTVLDNALKPPAAPFDQDALAIDALLATGRTVYRIFTGSNWGTNTISPTGTGGTGLGAFDDAIAQAVADGLPSTVDVWGTSAGACNTLNYAWRNPTKVNKAYLSSPGFDLSYLYDQDATTIGWGIGSVSASLRAVHGGTNKATWLPLSADYDPYRNTASVATIASKLAIFSARDDEVVPWSTLEAWCSSLSIPLTASAGIGVSGGGHLIAPSKANWSDLLPLRHFDQ